MGGGPPRFPRGFSCPAVLRILLSYFRFRLQGLYLLWPDFPVRSTSFRLIFEVLQPQWPKPLVWALPSSLAATKGIDFSFSSFGYLDVSVPRVVLITLWIHVMITGYCSRQVSPFGYLRFKACLRLPEAFRS